MASLARSMSSSPRPSPPRMLPDLPSFARALVDRGIGRTALSGSSHLLIPFWPSSGNACSATSRPGYGFIREHIPREQPFRERGCAPQATHPVSYSSGLPPDIDRRTSRAADRVTVRNAEAGAHGRGICGPSPSPARCVRAADCRRHLCAAPSWHARQAQNRTDPARGDGRDRRPGDRHAGRAAGRSVAGEWPLARRGARAGTSQGPNRPRPHSGYDARGSRYRHIAAAGQLLPATAAPPLPDTNQVP